MIAVHDIAELDVGVLDWSLYDIIILASGFEARSIHVLGIIPAAQHPKCIVLGFKDSPEHLSRRANDEAYALVNLIPFVGDSVLDYEGFLKDALYRASRAIVDRPMRIFVDYSAMTRIWYASILTWIKYSGDSNAVNIDFAYAHGIYEGVFENLQIKEPNTIPGFEGVSAGSRRTIALYGLGYDRFATLTVHDLIQPDSFICYIAHDPLNAGPAAYVSKENAEIIDLSGKAAILLPLDNLAKVVEELTKVINQAPEIDEVIAVPMGPKTHVLATLLAGQKLPRLICMHPMGHRDNPVQVRAQGRISCWRVVYR